MPLSTSPGLPDVRQLQDFELHTPLRIFTNDGKLIGEFGEERRMAIDFDEIPQDMINALIAAEDASYFDHAGVDPRGLARAAVELVQSGGTIQSGGSTITMQVARNYMLTLDQTFTRKIREILLALQMSRSSIKRRFSSFTSTKSSWVTAPTALLPPPRLTMTSRLPS